MKCKKWTEQENTLLTENYQLKKADLYELFPDRTAAAINIQSSKLGLRKTHNEYCESDTSVLLLDSPEAYYWVGFILADGHISNMNRLTIALANKDHEHLQKFADFISCKNLKKDKKNASWISIQDKVYIKLLRDKFDIKNDKTYYPPNLEWISDNELLISLLIGYIDGDGCIKYQSYRTDIAICFHVHSSWLVFLEFMKNKFAEYFGCISGNPSIGKDGYARYNICKNSIITGLKRFTIDNNLPVLDRKWGKITISESVI